MSIKDLSKVPYPIWKKIAWKYVRTFLVTFLATASLYVKNADSFDELWPVVILPAAATGLSALSKAAREYMAKDYEHLLHKLPI